MDSAPCFLPAFDLSLRSFPFLIVFLLTGEITALRAIIFPCGSAFKRRAFPRKLFCKLVIFINHSLNGFMNGGLEPHFLQRHDAFDGCSSGGAYHIA